jgi:hypothetical protein
LLRALFEAFRLEVQYDQSSRWADCRVTIDGDAVEQLTTESEDALQASAVTDFDGRSVPFWYVPPAGFERKGCTSALTLAATYVLA